MPIKVTVHVLNDEPFVAEMEELPDPTANYIMFTNPQTREGRPAPWQGQGATGFLFPWARVTYIEIMVNEDDVGHIEKHYRERSY